MSPEDFRHLCRWVGNMPGFSLLGGEPLMHSRMEELLQIAASFKKRINIISNISVDAETFDRLSPYFSGRTASVSHFLINTDYPDSQEEIFKRNLSILCHTECALSFSTTLLPDSDSVEASRKRIAELAEIYRRERGTIDGFRIRLAPFCPNPTDSTKFRKYNFTADIVTFVNSLYETQISRYGFDCPVNLCELNEDFIEACRNQGFQIKTDACSPESGMPFDILVDGSVIWCSSANFLRLNNWKDYPNFKAAHHELGRLWREEWKRMGRSTECRECDKNNPGRCSGLCIAKTHQLSGPKVIPVTAI